MTSTIPISSDAQAMANLRASAQRNPQQALGEIAGHFESLFTHMMLKSMRAASLGEGLFESRQAKMYRDLLDQEVATQLSARGGLGIAQLLIRQFGGEHHPEVPATAATQTVGHASAVAGARKTSNLTQAQATSWQPRDPLEFVRELLPHAKAAAHRLGVGVRGVLAQVALETGWGRKTPQRPDGGSSLNLFGIKAGGDWQGERVSQNTLEFRDGIVRRERAAFRAYDSIAASFDDYAKLLESNPRYADAIRIGDDPERFARELQRAGYATDPAYGQKIADIANGAEMRAALLALKQAPIGP